jgi:hypothetical protein
MSADPKHPHRIRKWIKRIGLGLLVLVALLFLAYQILALSTPPSRTEYGMSFSAMYAKELRLDWQEAYIAILDDLRVRKLRLMAHWPTIEPTKGTYDFSELQFQLDEAQKRGAKAIVAVGRRTPRWPECHVPEWYKSESEEARKGYVKDVVRKTVETFKDHPAVEIWQVENEPYLEIFAAMHCGDLDEDLLEEEIEIVRSIDPSRKILVTDSGNLGTWYKPYQIGDLFGTSVYIYLWNPEVGPFKSLLPPSFYRVKRSLMELFFANKPAYLIELSIEPWLLEPVADTPLEVQFERMSIEKFQEILDFAHETHFDRQYLWGAEWWYWLSKQGHPEFWEAGRRVFDQNRVEDPMSPYASEESEQG